MYYLQKTVFSVWSSSSCWSEQKSALSFFLFWTSLSLSLSLSMSSYTSHSTIFHLATSFPFPHTYLTTHSTHTKYSAPSSWLLQLQQVALSTRSGLKTNCKPATIILSSRTLRCAVHHAGQSICIRHVYRMSATDEHNFLPGPRRWRWS